MKSRLNIQCSIFVKILKIVFLSEVAHESFCVKFSGLISELRILKNHIEVHEYSTYRFIVGLFLKLRKSNFQEKKIYGPPMKPSE